MFTLRVGVSAWYTVNTLVIWLQWCTRGGCSCIFHGLDCSLGACEPIHCVFPFSFSFRRDVDRYCYITLELAVYLQFLFSWQFTSHIIGYKKLSVVSVNELVRHVPVWSSTQSYVGVLVNPRIMVAVSELLYRGSFCTYYGVPAVGIVSFISWKHIYITGVVHHS